MGLYLEDSIQYEERKDLNLFTDLVEALFVEFSVKIEGTEQNIIVSVAYRPPGTDLRKFNELYRKTCDYWKLLRERQAGLGCTMTGAPDSKRV